MCVNMIFRLKLHINQHYRMTIYIKKKWLKHVNYIPSLVFHFQNDPYSTDFQRENYPNY